MGMQIRISVNWQTIHALEVINEGHPTRGGWPEDDDLRRYSWSSASGASGTVEHRRNENAEVLTSKVMLDYDRYIRAANACDEFITFTTPAPLFRDGKPEGGSTLGSGS